LTIDPLPWLLEPENPSVRYWALFDLLDRRADDPQVFETREAISEQPLVKDLFARQQPGGYWGDETKPHNADGAAGVLNLMYLLGVPPNPRTAAGCDSFLRFCQHAEGGFSMIKQQRSGIFPCTTGTHLPFLMYFGFGGDPRLHMAFDHLIRYFSTDKALDCGRYQHRDCLWGAISALNGLAVLPPELHTDQSALVVKRLAETLLDAPYDFGGEHKRWLTFSVPRGWDLLSALKALAAHGYARDPRFTPLLQRVLDLQDAQGRWRCGSVSRTYPIEKRGQPSKWVTLDVRRVLKMANIV
jgi:hypothetical protein